MQISDNFNILQTTDVYEYNNVWLTPQQSSLAFMVKACGEVNLGLSNVAGDNSTIQLRVLIGGFDNHKSRIYYSGLSVPRFLPSLVVKYSYHQWGDRPSMHETLLDLRYMRSKR